MATVEKEEPSSSGSSAEASDPELDVTSPQFNPLKALYAPKVKLPHANVKAFASVAEYEKFVFNRDDSNEKQKGGDARSQPVRTQTRDLNTNERRPGLSVELYRPRKKKNLLIRMEEAELGPLSLLHRCVSEKVQACVVTRGFNNIQSICRGYIVAFDKHFNLAMIDVDETYRRHRISKKDKTKPATKSINIADVPESSILPRQTDPSHTAVQKNVAGVQSTTCATETTSEGSAVVGRRGKHEKPIPKTEVAAGASGREQVSESKASDRGHDTLLLGKEQPPLPRGQGGQRSAVPGRSSSSPSASDSKPPSLQGQSREDSRHQCHQPGSRGTPPSRAVPTPLTAKARQPAHYRTDEEVLGIRKSLIRHRHMGQIFIKGDNVISVYVQP